MPTPQNKTYDASDEPQVYAKPEDKGSKTRPYEDPSNLSGPQYLSTLSTPNRRRYCLDLSGKYNTNSPLKQFHCATFVFRNISDATQNAILTTALPNKIKYSFGGRWQSQFSALGQENFIGALVSSLTSGQYSAGFDISTATTWSNTEPMTILLQIPVFDDVGSNTGVNYQDAIELLAEAALPDVTGTGAYTKIPGPTAWQQIKEVKTSDPNGQEKDGTVITRFVETGAGLVVSTGSFIAGMSAETGANPWQRITLQLGGVLLMDWCIIKKVSVEFPNTKHQVLHDWSAVETNGRKMHLQPITAIISVEIETVQGLTLDKFRRMIRLQEPGKRRDEKQTKGICDVLLGEQPKKSNPMSDAVEAVWSGGTHEEAKRKLYNSFFGRPSESDT